MDTRDRFKKLSENLLLLGWGIGCLSSFLVGLGSILKMASNGSLPETPVVMPENGTKPNNAKNYFEL